MFFICEGPGPFFSCSGHIFAECVLSLPYLFTVSNIFTLDPAKSSSTSINTPMGTASSLSVSSAPKIDEYIPPEPTPNDPCPGYYQLPSGTWEAYDPTYYQQIYNKWKADYDREVRALEKKEKGFEDADGDDTQEVNALREMEKAKKEVQEREEKKALTQGAGGESAAPKMNIKVWSSHLRLSGLVC